MHRDPIQELPVIFSSSLKGAFRQAIEDAHENAADAIKEDIRYIFGNEVRNNGAVQPGKYIFHEARLLSLPVRSPARPYIQSTSPQVLEELVSHFEIMKFGKKEVLENMKKGVNITIQTGEPEVANEEIIDEFPENKIKKLSDASKNAIRLFEQQGLLSSPMALLHIKDFKEVCERLPVIARNQLENGVSQNLFYEEVVPRQTQFYFFVERPEDHDTFFTYLNKDLNMRVQIGANASIGYGVCTLKRISL